MKRNLITKKGDLKRYVATGLCMSLLTLGFDKSVYGATVRYNISELQERSAWCWVASARGVARAETTVTASQSNGVKAVKGSVVNEYGDIDEILEAAKYYSPGSDFLAYGNVLQFNQMKACIDNGHLIITVFDRVTAGVGHAMFIVGYSDDNGLERLYYCNPSVGGIVWCNYSVYDGILNGASTYKYVDSVFCRLK